MSIIKPMLAETCEVAAALRFPVLATPKLDGIRCLKIAGRAVSRTFKPIRNHFIRGWIEANLPDGLDGELMIAGATFAETTGHVGRADGAPDFRFHAFDYVSHGLAEEYTQRMDALSRLFADRLVTVLPKRIHNPEELTAYEEQCLAQGYEGVMVRTPHSPYKCGRSTVREGYLLKIKRFADAEAVVVDYEEQMFNGNEAMRDNFGRTVRSSAQAGKTGADTLGALVVTMDGLQFNIGTGFDAATRSQLWRERGTLIGRTVKFKHQPSGAKDAPRFPVFLGFREAWDMSAN